MGFFFFFGKNNRKSEQKVTRFISTMKNNMNKHSLLVNRGRNIKTVNLKNHKKAVMPTYVNLM